MTSKFIALALVGVLLASHAISAYAASPLSATCTGTPSTASIAWTSSVAGGVSPFVYLWSNGSTSSLQTVSYGIGAHSINLQVTDASSTIATANCTATVSQQATTTVQIKRMPKLSIEGNGTIEARAMTVKSAGTGSFTADIWGITYTVTSATAVVIGDYVDVVGKISTTSPLTIVAKNVRDYPTVKVVPSPKKEGWFNFNFMFKHDANDDRGSGKGKGKSGKDD
jgi:hypothetical protein